MVVSEPMPRNDRPASARIAPIVEKMNPEAIDGQRVGHDLVEDDPQPGLARRAGGFDEVAVAQGHGLGRRQHPGGGAQEVIAITIATETMPRVGR